MCTKVSKLHLCEFYCTIIEQNHADIPLIHMNNDSFVSFTAKDKHRDFKNLKDYFHIRNLAENYELYSNVIETDIGTLRIETPKIVCVGRLCTTGAQAPIVCINNWQ